MNKIALITGATSGIGKATALQLAEQNYDLIITGRRKERLESLATEIAKKFNCKIITLNFDIRNKQEVDGAIDSLEGNWKKIFYSFRFEKSNILR